MLNNDILDAQTTAFRFARERLLPSYMKRESEVIIDRRLMREMGEMGLICAELPESYGGMGVNSEFSGAIIEAIGYGDFNIAYVQLLGSLMAQIILDHGGEKAKTWLPKMARGEAICALGLTEPRGGSDAANLILSAKKTSGGYILKGEKSSISCADQADIAVIFARTGDKGAKGVSAFFIEMNTKGITTTRFNDLGQKNVGRGSIFFDDVFVPDENLMAQEGLGFVQVMQGFDFSRALIGLQCVGSAQASLDETWAYIQEREAFGKKIAAFQGVSFPLAEGESMMTAVRELCYHTLRLKDAGKKHTSEAAMCKWMAPKYACDAIQQCLLTHGHYGWSMDYPHQQRLRDVMGLQIGDGTAQIMKLIIAREKAGRSVG
jgi:cyclohexanecarboxyl-CoA dehydrogenase